MGIRSAACGRATAYGRNFTDNFGWRRPHTIRSVAAGSALTFRRRHHRRVIFTIYRVSNLCDAELERQGDGVAEG